MAIAKVLDDNGADVILWEFDRNEYNRLVADRGLEEKLAGFRLAESIDLTNDRDEAIDGADLIVLAIPSQSMRAALGGLKNRLAPDTPLVSLAKGIENESLQRMSEVIAVQTGVMADRIATLSGPSHAEEVAREMPTSVVVGSVSEILAEKLQERFSNQYFRMYTCDDVVGVELGGSLKNIIAIGVGITDGLGMGDNTRGALISRGLAEMVRLGTVLGAQPETFAGLSGLGDLITTCISRHSRNRHVGEKIGQGQKLADILKAMHMVAEGVATTRSGYMLSQKYDVEMPITEQVYQVLFEDKPPSAAVSDLMGRKLKAEIWR